MKKDVFLVVLANIETSANLKTSNCHINQLIKFLYFCVGKDKEMYVSYKVCNYASVFQCILFGANIPNDASSVKYNSRIRISPKSSLFSCRRIYLMLSRPLLLNRNGFLRVTGLK